MSMATASTAPICSGVRVAQNPSRLLVCGLEPRTAPAPVPDRSPMALAKQPLELSELNRALHGVPTYQQPGHCLLAGRLEPFNRQRFKQRREAAGGLGLVSPVRGSGHSLLWAGWRAGSYDIGTSKCRLPLGGHGQWYLSGLQPLAVENCRMPAWAAIGTILSSGLVAWLQSSF